MSAEKIVSRRYAKALVSVLKNGETTSDMASQLQFFRDAMLDVGSAFSCAMCYPAFSEADRLSVVEAVCLQEKVHEPVKNALKYLIEKNRISLLPQIYEAFVAEQDKLVGRVRTTVTTASPLSSAAETSIGELLRTRLRKDVIMSKVIDPDVIGGVRVQADDVVFDATLKSQLDRLKTEILARPL